MGDASDYEEWKEEEAELEYLQHLQGNCSYDCPYCEIEEKEWLDIIFPKKKD